MVSITFMSGYLMHVFFSFQFNLVCILYSLTDNECGVNICGVITYYMLRVTVELKTLQSLRMKRTGVTTKLHFFAGVDCCNR